MRIVYPKEIQDLRDSIPDEYFRNTETAPKEYQEKVAQWIKKSNEYDLEVRKYMWGF